MGRAFQFFTCVLLLGLVATGETGCSGKTRTVTTTTETVELPSETEAPSDSDAEPRRVQTTTTVTTEEAGGSAVGSVLRGTGKAIWWVVKLPFKVVAFVIDLLV